MRNEFSLDGSRWAQFSDDDVMRYHLVADVSGRHVDAIAQVVHAFNMGMPAGVHLRGVSGAALDITVFVMCNPSTADAFHNDPTVNECHKFTRRWNSDLCWVVNLWAFRSPYPAELFARPIGERGDDAINDQAIAKACRMARRVIVAWGNMGARDNRDRVMDQIAKRMTLYCLGTTQDGSPKHPLARGVHRIPADMTPQPWVAPCG